MVRDNSYLFHLENRTLVINNDNIFIHLYSFSQTLDENPKKSIEFINASLDAPIFHKFELKQAKRPIILNFGYAYPKIPYYFTKKKMFWDMDIRKCPVVFFKI